MSTRYFLSFQGWQSTSNVALPNSDQNEIFVDLESAIWEINRLYPNAENIAEINKIL